MKSIVFEFNYNPLYNIVNFNNNIIQVVTASRKCYSI